MTALPVKRSALEAIFVRTLNGLIQNRDEIVNVVGDAVNEAMLEAGEDVNRTGEVKAIDAQIEALQAQILELNKHAHGVRLTQSGTILTAARS